MNKQTKKSIKKEFINKVIATWGRNLEFAFLCGSFIRDSLNENSDIDMFICVKNNNNYFEEKFKKWYLKLHLKYQLKPDEQYFFEITDITRLIKSLELVEKVEPDFKLKTMKIYDGIVWAGMISGKKQCLFGNLREFLKLELKSKKIVKRWRKVLIKNNYDDPKLEDDLYLKFNTFYLGNEKL